eukprot:TRINITY_DN1971_c0_g1_i3.p2 TRINITY_DN1971_c0_g1~~TRINITY_DN1971_c0_g1_i3.p2  ORF type:complete len:128 (-),score=8.51 TRINITY_DN1971_c0_g1_i3:117-500(-)
MCIRDSALGLFMVGLNYCYLQLQTPLGHEGYLAVKKDDDRLHLVESNLNWLVQKFTRSFDQTLQTVERAKAKRVDNYTGQETTDIKSLVTHQQFVKNEDSKINFGKNNQPLKLVYNLNARDKNKGNK